MGISVISVYSVVNAVLFGTVGLFLVRILCRNTDFLLENSTAFLMIVLGFSLLRILIPIDVSHAFVVESRKVLPFIIGILKISVLNQFTVGMLIMVIWGSGTVLSLFKDLHDIIKEMRLVRTYRAVKNEQAERVLNKKFAKQKVTVMVSPDVDVPKVIGLVHAYIYIPPLSISDEELELVFRHELQHVKGKDVFIKLFYMLLKAVFWWNPIVHMFQQELENMLELRCDQAVTRKMMELEKVEYLKAVLNVIQQSKAGQSAYSFNTSALVKPKSYGITRQRFDVILKKAGGGKKSLKVGSVCLIAAAFLCSYFVIVQPVYSPPPEDIMGCEVITADNAYIVIDKDNKMKLYIEGSFYEFIEYDELRSDPYNDLRIIREIEESE